MIKWDEEIETIKSMLSVGTTLKDIGKHYDVSHQRIYQVLEKYGVETPTRQRTNKLRGREPKYYWLNTMLVRKGFTGDERTQLLDELELPDICPVLGIPLDYNGTGVSGSWSRRDNSPSIDQIEAGKGYTADNIAVISWRANRIKNDGTLEEHKKIVKWMKKVL